MKWIGTKLRVLAFSVLVSVSLAEVRNRPHDKFYQTSSPAALFEEARRVAVAHEATAPHLDHVDLADYGDRGEASASMMGPPSRAGVSTPKPPVTMLVPVYNEGTAVPGLLQRLEAVSAHYQVEAVAVDGGSKDDTLLQLTKAAPGLLKIEHELSAGYLAAIRSGVRATREQVIVIVDAYANIGPSVIARLLDALAADQTVAVALPTVPGVRVWRPLSARLCAWITRILLLLSTGRTARTLAPPVSAFKRAFLEGLLAQAPDHGLHPYAYAALLPGQHRIRDVRVG